MSKAMEKLREEALERGRMKLRAENQNADWIPFWLESWVEGWVEGYISTLAESIRNLKKNLGLSAQQVKEILEISDDDGELIAAQI